MYVYYGKANMKNVNKKEKNTAFTFNTKYKLTWFTKKQIQKRYSTHDNSIWLVNDNRYWLYHIQNSTMKDNPPYESVFVGLKWINKWIQKM